MFEIDIKQFYFARRSANGKCEPIKMQRYYVLGGSFYY